MKRTKLLCIVLAVIMSASTPVLGVDANAQMNELSDVPHAYYVKAGTETWNKLTVNERIEVSCVEIEECQNMTTRALVQTVLEYPYIIDIFAYPKERGVEVVASWFPALMDCPYYGKTGGLEDGYPGITIIEYWELEE